jgi:hypothetical protein
VRYRIVVASEIDPREVPLAADLEARCVGARTELVGEIVDQSQLVGIISRLASMGVELISVAPTPTIESPPDWRRPPLRPESEMS